MGVTQGSRDEASSGKGITVSTQSLGEQTVDLLARLVRLGCVNDLTADSGGEERAADLLEEFFAGLPVSIERITPHPGRTTLVVTLEPCAMCAGAMVGARVRTVVFGAWEPRTGACGSVFDVARESPLHAVEVRGGVLLDECEDLVREFFSSRR